MADTVIKKKPFFNVILRKYVICKRIFPKERNTGNDLCNI